MLSQKQIATIDTMAAPRFSWAERTKQVIVYTVFNSRGSNIEATARSLTSKLGFMVTEADLKEAYKKEINAVLSSNNKNSEAQVLSPMEYVKVFISEVRERKEFWFNSTLTEIRYGCNEVSTATDIDGLWNYMQGSWAPTFKNKYVCEEKSEVIKSALKTLLMQAKTYVLGEIRKAIAYDENSKENADKCLHIIYDYFGISEDYEIFDTLMKHWLWQVKRKILNKEVKWHLWINFFGATGIGKSYVTKKLCDVMDDFVSETSVAKLFDDTKEVKRLTEKYILRMDEIAINSNGSEDRLNEDENNILKQILTQNKLDTRVYGTQDQAKRAISFSVISTANTHLYDVIFDEKSMRRFFDFTCTAKKPKDYSKINHAYDLMIDLWKSVDENLEEGYWDQQSEIGKKISSIQESYYPTKTTVIEWLNNNDIIVSKDGNRNRTGTTEYKNYAFWARENGYKPKALSNFIAEIKKRFPEEINKSGIIYFTDKVSEELNTDKSFTKDPEVEDFEL